MKKLCFAFTLLLFSGFLLAQPFQVGSTTITFTDASRANRQIPVELYYPAINAGSNVPVAGAVNQTFSVISFGHGFVMSWDSYRNFWENLVPEGYIMAFPKTETGFSPNHLEFAKDIAFVIAQMQLANSNSLSLFFGKVSAESILMGHSMGGGSSILASQYVATPHFVVAIAPAETNPSAISAAQSLTMPSLIFAGANDCVTPSAQHQIPIYQALSGSCKSYVEIVGASHCQFANSNFNCNFGELTCSPAATISRAQQHAVQFRLMKPWLDAQLNANCSSWNNFQTDLLSAVDISYQQSCTFCTVSATLSAQKTSIEIFPNPASDKLWVNGLQTGATLEFFNSKGQIVKTFVIGDDKNEMEISLVSLPKGVYILKYKDSFSQMSSKVLIF